MKRVVLWDFDGTLAERPGMWGSCLVETLDEHEPGHEVTVDSLRASLRDGFPWHVPERPHPELCNADAWWRRVGALLARAYEGAGFTQERSAELAVLARARYLDHGASWRVFDDAVPALSALRARGWSHVLLSNHVPELSQLVEGLGLARWFDAVLSSAVTGFEKPHPEAYALAVRAAADPTHVWMVGDDVEADVLGAERLGISAVLARRSDPRARRAVDTLDDLGRYID